MAVPPTAPAGVTPVREIEPDAGVGETGPSVSDVTVPSVSVAETAAVAALPWSTESDGGHVTTTGALPPVTVCEPSPSNVSVRKAVPLDRRIERVRAVRVARA